MNYSNTHLSYALPEEKAYVLLISDKHQYIFTDCAFISLKSGGASATVASRYQPTSRVPAVSNPPTSGASGLKKQQIRRYDYADYLISNVTLTTPSFTNPVSDGILEFRINRQSSSLLGGDGGGSSSQPTATIGSASTSAGNKSEISSERKSYEIISIDIKRSDWSNKIKVLYRTLVALQRCQRRLDSAFELEKHILTKGLNISIPAVPPGTDINYYPEYSDFFLAQQRQQTQHSCAVYSLITALTESSLTRYKPMSFKAVWEESMNKSLGLDMSNSSTEQEAVATDADNNFSTV